MDAGPGAGAGAGAGAEAGAGAGGDDDTSDINPPGEVTPGGACYGRSNSIVPAGMSTPKSRVEVCTSRSMSSCET